MSAAFAKVAAAPGCTAIELDGRCYPVHDGHARVDGPRAAELLRVADAIPGGMVTFAGAEGRYCATHRRRGFAWEQACPRCEESA